jgi:hypothetical protein
MSLVASSRPPHHEDANLRARGHRTHGLERVLRIRRRHRRQEILGGTDGAPGVDRPKPHGPFAAIWRSAA